MDDRFEGLVITIDKTGGMAIDLKFPFCDMRTAIDCQIPFCYML